MIVSRNENGKIVYREITSKEIIDYVNGPYYWYNKLMDLHIGNKEPLILKGLLMTKQMHIDDINKQGEKEYKYEIKGYELFVYRIK